MMQVETRKLVTVTETFRTEGGRELDAPHRLAAVGAVVANPLVGRLAEDLSPLVGAISPVLGPRLGEKVVDLLDGHVEVDGKRALVGADGELEHGFALIHRLRCGDPFRDTASGTALRSAAEKRDAVGATLGLSLKHKDDGAPRSHHWTFEVRLTDAQRTDEIAVYCAAAGAGRPPARIGAGPQVDG